jgi:hypothetical protein
MVPLLAAIPDSSFAPIIGGSLMIMLWQGGGAWEKADTVHTPSVEKLTLKPVEEHKDHGPVKTEKPQVSKAHDDEKFFEQVAAELEEGSRKKGLWLKAETKAGGDKDKARLLYIGWRVEQLSGEEFEAQRQKEEAELEAQQKAAAEAKVAAEAKAAQRKLELQEELKSFDSTEALDELKQHGYTWISDFSVFGRFRGWLIFKSGYKPLRLRSKAELKEWLLQNIPKQPPPNE